jgi:hypothetical protein
VPWFLILTLILFISSCGEEGSVSDTPPSDCVSNTNPEFSNMLMDPLLLSVVIPPGLMTETEPKSHTYLVTNVSYDKAPIYAPTDMTLSGILYYDSQIPNGKGDTFKIYNLDFFISCEVSIWLDHVYEPIERIVSAGATTPAQSTSSDNIVTVDMKFSAGDIIGYAQPNSTNLDAAQLDFGLKNTSKTNTFIREKAFDSSKFKNHDCPYTYFSDNLQNQYEALYGDSSPVTGGLCRSPAVDAFGSLSGYWFKTKTSEQPGFEGLLAIGLLVDEAFVQVGGLQSKYFSAERNSAKKPADVKPGESICYGQSGNGAHIYFKLIDATILQVAYHASDPNCPDDFPESPKGYELYETYYR